ITQVEADRILNRLNQTEADPRPKTLFEPGEELLVIDGPFTDFKGLVEKVDYEKSRSEEHTSELQSRFDLVCRLLLEKKKEYTKRREEMTQNSEARTASRKRPRDSGRRVMRWRGTSVSNEGCRSLTNSNSRVSSRNRR